jgi:altronate dehydratase
MASRSDGKHAFTHPTTRSEGTVGRKDAIWVLTSRTCVEGWWPAIYGRVVFVEAIAT